MNKQTKHINNKNKWEKSQSCDRLQLTPKRSLGNEVVDEEVFDEQRLVVVPLNCAPWHPNAHPSTCSLNNNYYSNNSKTD
eukprot:2538066-Amphidinium_carterae.1